MWPDPHVKLYVRLSEAAILAITDLAIKTDRTLSEVVEVAVIHYLNKHKNCQQGVLVPPRHGELMQRCYSVGVETFKRLVWIEENRGLGRQNVVRSAIFDQLGVP